MTLREFIGRFPKRSLASIHGRGREDHQMPRQKPVWLEPWWGQHSPQAIAALHRSAAADRCTGLTRKGERCRRRAIRGAKRCRMHLGSHRAHAAFHARRQDAFYAGQLSWEGWDFQRQQRARKRLGKRLGERTASRWPEPGFTLVFSGVLEARFRQNLERHLRQHIRDWDDLPDAHRDCCVGTGGATSWTDPGRSATRHGTFRRVRYSVISCQSLHSLARVPHASRLPDLPGR